MIKYLVRHPDKRGFFCEIIRRRDPIIKTRVAQVSHALARTGVLKAWHLHRRQTDWMYVVLGEIQLVLYDTRTKSPTFGQLMEFSLGNKNRPQVIKIPPGVAHGYKVTKGPMHIIYIADREYDSEDIIIIPPTNTEIGYDWTRLTRTKKS